MRTLLATPLLLLSLALLPLALLAGGLGGCSSRSDGPGDAAWHPKGDHLEVSVWKTYCEGCQIELEKEIGKVAGVREVHADWKKGLVSIDLVAGTDRAAVLPELREAVHRCGKRVVGEEEIPKTEG